VRPTAAVTAGVLALLTLIWGSTWSVIRIGLEGVPPLLAVSLRFAAAAIVLLAVARARGIKLGRAPYEKAVWVSNTVLSFSISYPVVYWCEQYVPSGLAAILWATFPLFVAIVAHFTLAEERLTARTMLGALIGFGGVAVIFSEDLSLLGGPKVALASGVMLLSPLAGAFSNVIIKRWAGHVSSLSIAGVPMAMAAVVLGAASLAFERGRPVAFTPRTVGAILYLALFGSAVTFALYYWLLAHHRATRMAMINYAIPVVAVIIGAVFMNEPMTGRVLAGSVLVVAGVALATRATRTGPGPGEPEAPPTLATHPAMNVSDTGSSPAPR
jgi:drug/metabolite transporter (DMT)-like permease